MRTERRTRQAGLNGNRGDTGFPVSCHSWSEVPVKKEKGVEMRGIGNHIAPLHTLLEPADNTSREVALQVDAWAWVQDNIDDAAILGIDLDVVIHPEAAREIASWWQGPTGDGLEFARFASTGTVTWDLPTAIDRGIRSDRSGDTPALDALRAYIAALPAVRGAACGCGALGDHDESHER